MLSRFLDWLHGTAGASVPAVSALPVEVAPEPRTITNTTPGTMLHLGDGRKLAFGETAELTDG